MAIFVDDKTKVVYQGLTGSQGKFYGLLNRDYGTQVVAGTNPKKAGTDVDGIPVYATVAEAVQATGATASCIFIPAPGVKDAVMEAAEGGVKLIVAITEGVPAHDEAWFFNKLKRDFPDVRLLGPNCPGIISPGKANIGITAGHIAKAPVEGQPNVGIVSRSGTLTYQALYELKLNDIGVTTCVGIGGDPVPGTSFIDCLQAFEADPDTKAVMMIGEIGGSAEEEAAAFIAESKVAMCVSGVSISTSASQMMSSAVKSPGPFLLIVITLGCSPWSLTRSRLRFRTTSVTSSLTPGIVENSCSTPSILIEVTAAPTIDESNTRRKPLPIVAPNPRSKGSAVNLPYVSVKLSLSHSNFRGV